MRARAPINLSTAVGFLIVAIYLFPIYWMVTGSIKHQDDLFASPPQLIPVHPQLHTWSQAILQGVGAAGVAFIGAEYLIRGLRPGATPTPYAVLVAAVALMLVLLSLN